MLIYIIANSVSFVRVHILSLAFCRRIKGAASIIKNESRSPSKQLGKSLFTWRVR